MVEESTSPPVSAAFTRKSSQQLFRFFSTTESTRSSTYIYGEVNAKPQWEHDFKSKEFGLKIAQVFVAILCTGLYTRGIKVVTNSITTAMFPNVVFSAFIIITSVILISYILGHVMPEVLIRIFNSLATILYFVSASITGQYWLVQGRLEARDGFKDQTNMNLLLAETILCFFNTFLYGIDVYFSVKGTLKGLEIPPDETKKDRTQSKV